MTRTPPRIRDPELIKNTIQSIAYYADKLDGLHSEYRRCYAEQQQLTECLQTMQQMQHTMDPNEYHKSYNYYRQKSTQFSVTLNNLVISIYERFTEMKHKLALKHDYLLDAMTRKSFDKFQKYHDKFGQSQQPLLVFGQQQLAAAKARSATRSPSYSPGPLHHQQGSNHQATNTHNHSLQYQNQCQTQYSPPAPQHGQQQQHHYNHRIAATPSKYQNYVTNSFKEYNQNNQSPNGSHSPGTQNYLHLPHMQGVHSMTPRGAQSPGYDYNRQQPLQRRHQLNVPHSTTALDQRSRSFQFSQKAQQQHMYNKNNSMQRQTPQSTREYGSYSYHQHPSTGYGHNGSPRKNGYGMSDIPQMGYVYIGSRMSQMISQIAVQERELSANQQRIQSIIARILERDDLKEMFKEFDIVPYGASTHGLFIKEYSDYDYCIRCKDLSVSHKEAINAIAKAMEEKQDGVADVKVVETLEDSVHGNYLKDIEHIVFRDKETDRTVDLVLNNLPEIGASRFIAAYESIDPRFALLCRVVKYWARQRKINDPLNGSLSTFSLVLMVINFLQSRRVMPTLSIMIFDRETGLSPWSTQDDYQINVQKYRDFSSKNEEPHSRLLVNFFHFYSHKFKYGKDVVSVRTGTLLTKSEKKWNAEQHLLAVENPFNSSVNLTENVTMQCLHRISAEFKRAHSILCESYKIYEVCKLASK